MVTSEPVNGDGEGLNSSSQQITHTNVETSFSMHKVPYMCRL